GAVKEAELPALIRRMKQRASAELRPSQEAVLWAETFVLMGLRFNEALAMEILKGVRAMKESVTYQAIIREGREEGLVEGRVEGEVKEAQRILLLLGSNEFGPPDKGTEAALNAIADRDRLEALIQQVGKAKSWREILGKGPARRQIGGKKKK